MRKEIRCPETEEFRISREAASGNSPGRQKLCMNYRGAHSPPWQGGVAAPSKNGPFRRGADGVVNLKLCIGMRSERCRVIDHSLCFALSRSRCAPVCGVAVASRLFIDAAATPPWQGGENAQTEQSGNPFTFSPPGLISCRRFAADPNAVARSRRIEGLATSVRRFAGATSHSTGLSAGRVHRACPIRQCGRAPGPRSCPRV